MVFPVVMYGCKSWTIKKSECRRIDAFKLWCESPLNSKWIKSVSPKGNQPWIFIGRTDAETYTPVLWPPGAKNWLIWKDPDAGKEWRQKEKGMTEWEGWMASPIQWTWVWANSGRWWRTGSLACCSPWGCKELDMTEWLNWTELNWILHISKISRVTI